MRSIKFRAYDKLEKRMCKVVSLHWQDDKLVAVKVDGEAEPLPIEGRFVIEQDTGLKDRKGVEICEGDIVKTPEYNVEVIYDDTYACFEFKTARYSSCFVALTQLLEICIDDLEIIGNTHENQELMEER